MEEQCSALADSWSEEVFAYRSCTFKVTAGALAFIVVHWIAIGTMGTGGWMFVMFLVEE